MDSSCSSLTRFPLLRIRQLASALWQISWSMVSIILSFNVLLVAC